MTGPALRPEDVHAEWTQTNVNYGDHAQDVTVAVGVDLSETVRDLLDRTLAQAGWRNSEGDYLVIRVVPETYRPGFQPGPALDPPF